MDELSEGEYKKRENNKSTGCYVKHSYLLSKIGKDLKETRGLCRRKSRKE